MLAKIAIGNSEGSSFYQNSEKLDKNYQNQFFQYAVK